MFNWLKRRDRDPDFVEADDATTQGTPVPPEELAEEALAAPPEDELVLDEQEEEREAGLEDSLEKTRGGFFSRIRGLFSRKNEITEDFFDELEELLIQADVGVATTARLIETLRERIESEGIRTIEDARETFQDEMAGFLDDEEEGLNLEHPVNLLLVVGVNGAGKTTTIGKLATYLQSEGHKVVLAAGDTFRAAAIEQLQAWGQRANVPVVAHQPGSDPGAVIFDAISSAEARGADVVIADTAGRLHTKFNLMEELRKIANVAEKRLPGSPHEVLLILDATNGQNALAQAKQFTETVPVTGLIVTKLDSTSKGGIIFAIRDELDLPIKFVGTGEKLADLAPFDPDLFVETLFA
ncbi:MAG TPA: signal recognition particle-docking protein FtsY [Chloroflexota bacterium]|nr:signal recognition particle-docking protein FtsY [Chloroflexota bacterium]